MKGPNITDETFNFLRAFLSTFSQSGFRLRCGRTHRGRSGHVAEKIEVVDILRAEPRDEGEREGERDRVQ